MRTQIKQQQKFLIPNQKTKREDGTDLEIDLDAVDQEEDDHDEHQHSVASVEQVREEALQNKTGRFWCHKAALVA